MTTAISSTILTDAKRRLLDDESSRDPDLRLGRGATVSQLFVQAKSRSLFLYALWKLLPDTTTELLAYAPPATISQYLEQQKVVTGNPDAMIAAGPDRFARTLLEAAQQVEIALNEHISRWQLRYHLHDPWVAEAARFTLEATSSSYIDGNIYQAPLLLSLADTLADVHDDLDIEFRVVLSGKDADLGTFDPRVETVDAAVRRLLPDLKQRLRRSLESIADSDLASNAPQHSKTLDTLSAFDWLVRYQVIGHSKTEIAQAVHKDRTHVTREINAAAKLIGLTLRDPKRGRPRRKHANTKTVR